MRFILCLTEDAVDIYSLVKLKILLKGIYFEVGCGRKAVISVSNIFSD